jgi:hypothetical protein
MCDSLQGGILWVAISLIMIISGIHGVLNKKQKTNKSYQTLSRGQIGIGIFSLIIITILLLMGKW